MPKFGGIGVATHDIFPLADMINHSGIIDRSNATDYRRIRVEDLMFVQKQGEAAAQILT